MHSPRKRFGQHFLCDKEVIARIVAVIAPKRGERIVEIGPGQGAITFPILKIAKHLDAVEFDRDLIPHLQERSPIYGFLNIHEADALTFDFSRLHRDDRKLRIIGNLPYNISTPLLFHLLEYAPLISDMIFMLQKEVAHRLAAEPSSEFYGRLSVMMQYHCQVQLIFDVQPNAFYPQPKVKSSIIKLIPYQQLPHVAKDYKRFSDLVRQAFSLRRKTLHNSLKSMVTDDTWEKVQIDSRLRPENLSVGDYVKISNALET